MKSKTAAFVSMREAAGIFGIECRTLKRAVEMKQAPSVIIGGRRLIPRAALERLAQGGK
jgi:excisionase family DNA binding protein